MLGKSMLMKCGHYADSIMTDVPYKNERIDLAACSHCFDDLGTAIQPACNGADKKPALEPLPKIKRDYAMVLVGAALTLLTVIILIASY